MAYQNNIPRPTDRLKDSQQDIQNNFAAIKTLIDENHGTFGSATQGQHEFIQLPTATPTKDTTATPQVGLYSKVGATSAVPELYFQRSGLDADSGYSITEGGNTAAGWARLPSGLLIKWGYFTPPGAGTSHIVSYNTVGPSFTVASAPFSIQITNQFTNENRVSDFDRVWWVTTPINFAAGQFTVKNNQGGTPRCSFYWTVMGVE